jgi:hypothetical protein
VFLGVLHRADADLQDHHLVPKRSQERVILDVGANKGVETVEMLQYWGRQWAQTITAIHPGFCKLHSIPPVCEWPPVTLHALDLNPANADALNRTAGDSSTLARQCTSTTWVSQTKRRL